jgi:hypothetical protein
MVSSTGSSRFPRFLLTVLTSVALLVVPAAPAAASGPGWVGTWATAMQPPTDLFGPTWSLDGFDNHTVRQVVRVSAGGSLVRIRLSNVESSTPLRVAGATIATAGQGASVRPGSVRRLTFGHATSVTVPPGGERASDAAPLLVRPLDRLTISRFVGEPTGPTTFLACAAATW